MKNSTYQIQNHSVSEHSNRDSLCFMHEKGFTKRFSNWRNWVYKTGSVITMSIVPINSHKRLKQIGNEHVLTMWPRHATKDIQKKNAPSYWMRARTVKKFVKTSQKNHTHPWFFIKSHRAFLIIDVYRRVSWNRHKLLLESARARTKIHLFERISKHEISSL